MSPLFLVCHASEEAASRVVAVSFGDIKQNREEQNLTQKRQFMTEINQMTIFMIGYDYQNEKGGMRGGKAGF